MPRLAACETCPLLLTACCEPMPTSPYRLAPLPCTASDSRAVSRSCTPHLPTNIIPTKIARFKLSGKFPMGLGMPPLKIKIMLESNPLKSIMLVRRLAVNFPSLWSAARDLLERRSVVVVRLKSLCHAVGATGDNYSLESCFRFEQPQNAQTRKNSRSESFWFEE